MGTTATPKPMPASASESTKETKLASPTRAISVKSTPAPAAMQPMVTGSLRPARRHPSAGQRRGDDHAGRHRDEEHRQPEGRVVSTTCR